MPKFMKKPEYIEAVQWTGNLEELCKLVPERHRNNKIGQPLGLITAAGIVDIPWKYWVVRNIGQGYSFKVVSPEEFEETYVKADE